MIDQKKIRVLLIEDVAIYVGMLQRVLGSSGFLIISVYSLKDGLNAAGNGDIDVVLLDLGLPDSYGLRTFSTFSNIYPELPVVILTGTDDEDMAAQAVHLGAQDYLIKGPHLMREDTGKKMLIRSLLYAVERNQIQSSLKKERDLLEDRVSERTSELRKTNEHLSALIDAIPDLMCRIDRHGIVIDVKVPDAFIQYFPNLNDLVGKYFLEATTELLPKKLFSEFHKSVDAKKPEIFEHELNINGETHFFDIRMVTSQGSETLILIRDVTESKALERMWRRYEFIANTSNDMLTLIDRDYRYQAVNDAFCQGNLLVRENIIGGTVESVWGSDVFIEEIKPNIDLSFSGKVHTQEYEFKHGNLKGRYFEVTYYPYYNQSNEVTHIVIVSRDRTEYHRTERMLWQYNERLRYLTTQLVSAQEEERRRISLELHDEAGQALTALKLKLALAKKLLPPDLIQTHDQLKDSIILVENTMDQIRGLAHDLRPPALDAIGINQAMEDYCQQFSERSEIKVIYKGSDFPDLPSHIQINLYRVLQEALNNVIKHAKASLLTVNLFSENEKVLLNVEDNGIGFERKSILGRTPRKGMGLLGIEERMEALGGSLELKTKPGEGTIITAIVPWEEA